MFIERLVSPSVSFTLALCGICIATEFEVLVSKHIRRTTRFDVVCAPIYLPLAYSKTLPFKYTNLEHTILNHLHISWPCLCSCKRVQHRGAGHADLPIRALRDRLPYATSALGVIRDQGLARFSSRSSSRRTPGRSITHGDGAGDAGTTSLTLPCWLRGA